MHNGSAELKIVVRLDTLLRDRLRDTLTVTTLELTREQVAEPTLEERDDATHEEQPYTPAGCPETDTRALANRTRVEAVVDEVLEILRHPNLPHQLRAGVSIISQHNTMHSLTLYLYRYIPVSAPM